jgi:PAS domain S-box-containing protein
LAHRLIEQQCLDLERQISEGTQSEERCRLMAAALDSVGEGIAITGVDGVIEYVNARFERHTGYTREEAIGRKPNLLKSGVHDEAFYREMWATLLRGEIWSGTLVNRRKDGTLYHVEQTIAPVKDEQGDTVRFIAVERDITARRLAEQTIAELQMRMLTSSRMAALGIMAGNVAHEIRNPLTVISGDAEMLREAMLRECPERPDWVNRLEAVVRNAARIERIVRGLRTLSREGGGDPFVLTAMKDIVDDAVELCRARFKPGNISLLVEPVPPDLRAECRATQIAQLLLNLLNNAVDAVRDLPERWVRIECREDGVELELAVKDSGSGLSPEVRQRIFRRFFTTKTEGNGVGLGLSISQAIMESHHGRLYIDETCPHTRFVARLPRHQPAEDSAESKEPNAAAFAERVDALL